MAKSTEWLKKVEMVVNQLADEVDEVKASEMYQKHLETMSKFWSYSLRNQILIGMQWRERREHQPDMPEASRVAGYNTWKLMGRYVKSGERAIRILAPGLKKVEDKNGEEDHIIQYFFPVCVFDISQTDGEPLEVMDCHVEGESSKMHYESLVEWCQENGIAVKLESLGSNSFGSSMNGSVVINDNDSVDTKFGTLVHELAHEFLHWDDMQGEKRSKQRVEAEAEGASYVVLTHYGIETSAPTYLSLATKDRKVLMASLSNISEAAKRIIAAVDSKLPVEQEVAA